MCQRSNEVTELSLTYLSNSRFERVLRSGKFAITVESKPPDSANPEEVYSAVLPMSEVADAINASDAPGANSHMSSAAISAILEEAGYSAIYQISCRDRNRIAIQGDVLGAAALGVKNILCLTGDSVGIGDQPNAKPVFDLDSISLLKMLKNMRDNGKFLSGRNIKHTPKIFIGAVENPCAPPFDLRAVRVKKKIEAGADFIQTNYIFDLPRFETFMEKLREDNLHKKAFIIAGVGSLASAKAACWMRTNIPGIYIPDHIIHRLEKADDQGAEAVNICVELVQKIREIEGVSGIHLMAHNREHTIPAIIKRSEILYKRQIKSF